ncbi:hypothetical protein BJX66DRAFT_353385 [Aspergillus keveii]|uniref:Zn(2)-C6 fungal-type domain-containing protein n=1 Tax=Aspergillus keveii TaxID=714993 RepID=A0ABR4FVZ4_9EURO
MSFPSQTRVKKTEITRSRNGCVRCRQKRRKCDEGKPGCRRCITAGTDCHYDGFTLKFREATQWAAHKVESRRGLAETPPSSTNDAVEDRAGSLNEARQPLQIASYDCAVLPSGRTPVTFDEDSPCQDLSNSLDSPKWAEVPLDFDLLPSGDADIFNEFLSQLSWTGTRNQPWEISPPSSSQGEVIAQHSTQDGTLAYDAPTVTEPQCSRVTTRQEQQATWPPMAGAVMIPQPPLKARKPPPTKVPVNHRIYLAHFRVAVLQAFPLDLPFLWALVIDSPAVRYAALALAAASLANLQGKQKDHSTWAPMPIHSTKAAAFSAQANRILEGGSDVPLNARLTAMLLLIYHELEAGSFSDAFHSLSILSATILDHAKAVSSLAEGPDLIRWWIHLRCLTGSAHTPLNPYGREDPAESLASRLEMSVATAAQLWQRILKGNLLSDRGAFDVSETSGHFLTEGELFAELRTLKMMLATCETPSALRAVATTTATTAPDGIVDLTRITTHREAMEAIDYAFAQIVCDETLLRTLADTPTTTSSLPRQFPLDNNNDNNNNTSQPPQQQICGRENAYRRGGMLNTLYYTGLFCPGQVPSRVMYATVQRLLDARVHAESPFFPVHAFAGYQRALEREIAQRGRTVFFACLTYDEWTTKDRLFSRGEKELVIVVGAEGDGRRDCAVPRAG